MDQDRYMRFLDFSTAIPRVEASTRGFIQNFFRMRWSEDQNNWHVVRFTRVPSSAEKAYLLTIQQIQGKGIEVMELIAREHPELLD
jgi:hypothetical protein